VLIYLPTQTSVFKGVNISYSSLNPFTKSTVLTYSERIPVTFPPLATIENFSTNSVETPTDANENIVNNKVEITQEIPTEVISKSSNSIHLIVGAFGTQENAQALVNELNSKGYKAYVQGKSNSGLFRVSCNKFTSKEAALSAKLSLPQELNGWVLSE
jgi:cell division septation protein DedD